MTGIHAKKLKVVSLVGGGATLSMSLDECDEAALMKLAPMVNKNVVVILEDDFIRPKDTRHEDNVAYIRAKLDEIDDFMNIAMGPSEPAGDEVQAGIPQCDKCDDTGNAKAAGPTGGPMWCDCKIGQKKMADADELIDKEDDDGSQD